MHPHGRRVDSWRRGGAATSPGVGVAAAVRVMLIFFVWPLGALALGPVTAAYPSASPRQVGGLMRSHAHHAAPASGRQLSAAVDHE
mmetsp:Transcript_29858/g.81962  ORF Transcript_29858/g.81962 Transcript_29858/m.81962 type:complete len:86 (-) Transcript_29858:155-412(-)